MITKQEALSFLKGHQPMPRDDKFSIRCLFNPLVNLLKSEDKDIKEFVEEVLSDIQSSMQMLKKE